MDNVVKLEEYVTVKRVENKLINLYKQKTCEVDELFFDLRECSHIRVEALVYMMAITTGRFLNKKQNLKTFFYYPDNKNERSFIYTFRFFETISQHTSKEIEEFVLELPLNFIQNDSTDGRKSELTKERVQHFEKKGFYPLISLKFNSLEEKKNTLKEEPKKWTEGQPIISVIQKNIPENIFIGNKISRNIIYESITNSIRHPNSKLLTVNCIKEINNNDFILTIWDNGESMIETLKKELDLGNSIKDFNNLEDDPHFCFCCEKENHKSGRKTITSFDFYFSHEVPDYNDTGYRKEDWFILLSCFFPGITRDPQGNDYKTGVMKDENSHSKDEISNTENQAERTSEKITIGRGLSYLLNTSVNILGAEIRIRTGKFFLNVKKATKDYSEMPRIFSSKYPDYHVIEFENLYPPSTITNLRDKKILQAVYKVKIDEIETLDDFYGNMITIQIPQTGSNHE
jgi:hypothetical protein